MPHPPLPLKRALKPPQERAPSANSPDQRVERRRVTPPRPPVDCDSAATAEGHCPMPAAVTGRMWPPTAFPTDSSRGVPVFNGFLAGSRGSGRSARAVRAVAQGSHASGPQAMGPSCLPRDASTS